MARIIYPKTFDGQFRLLKLIKQKHDADGPASPLTGFLTENDIDLAALVLIGGSAETQHALAAQLAKDGERLKQERDLLFAPVKSTVRKGAQFLKALYATNNRELGLWALNVDGDNRIVYPKKLGALYTQATKFIAKHTAFAPPTSPLQPFIDKNNIDMPALAAATTAAVDLLQQIQAAKRAAESATQQRNLLWKPVLNTLRGLGTFLIKLNPSLPKELGTYGFSVDDSPRKPRVRKSIIKPAQKRTIGGVVIGGELINRGEEVIHLIKGRKQTGEIIQVSPGQSHSIAKGFSVITIVNPDMFKKAVVTVLSVF